LVGACGQAAKLAMVLYDTQADRNRPMVLVTENNNPLLPYNFLNLSAEHFPLAYHIQILPSFNMWEMLWS